MARIAGVDLPRTKRVEIGLTYIYGIGRKRSNDILTSAGVGPDIEVEFDPAAWRQGRDPQLERTVEYLMEELKKNPRPQYKRPAFPNYHQSNPVVTTGQGGRTGQQ